MTISNTLARNARSSLPISTKCSLDDPLHPFAELLAEAIDAGLSGRRELALALGDYEQQRNEETRPIYELNYQRASLDPPSPEMLHLLAALRGNQVETNRFFGTMAGTVPIPDFFAPEHIERVIAASSQ